MFIALGLIAIGLAGASCFAVGIIWSLQAMVITGIILTALCIAGMGVFYWYSKPKPTITHYNDVKFSTNNMNTMKRNKSDTDLELINKQTEKNSIVDENHV
jgi:hypothetical protein